MMTKTSVGPGFIPGRLARFGLVFPSLVLLASCGPPSLQQGQGGYGSTSEKSETLGNAGGQCRDQGSADSPYLVEWDPTTKARMETTSGSGVLLVRYQECTGKQGDRVSANMEVLYGCEAPGAYKLDAVAPKKQSEAIRSVGDLFAKLKIGAINLAADYHQGEEWSLDYVLSGMRTATVGGVSRVGLAGRCAGATHFVSAMAIGAYRLQKAASRTGGGEATIHGQGVGGSSGGAAESLRSDGLYDDCLANRDAANDRNCQAIVRLFLTPLDEAPSQPSPNVWTSTGGGSGVGAGATGDFYSQLGQSQEGPPFPATTGAAGSDKQYKSDLEKAWAAVKKAVKGAGADRQLELYQRFLSDFPVENPYAAKARKEADRLDAELTMKAEADAKAVQAASQLAAQKARAEQIRQAYETAKAATGTAEARLAAWQAFAAAYPGSDNLYLATAQREIAALEPQAEAEHQAEAARQAEVARQAETARQAEQQRLAAERAQKEAAAKAAAAQAAIASSGAEVQEPGTNLYWLRCPVGQTWNGSACTGSAKKMKWGASKSACPSGYRLPTRQEFFDSGMFPGDTNWYWSSSAYVGGIVGGGSEFRGIAVDCYVRCVAEVARQTERQRLAAEGAQKEAVAKAAAAQAAIASSGAAVQQPGTNLYWLRCPVGQTWSGSLCTGVVESMIWSAAKSACPSGYRLPTRQEFVELLGGCVSRVTSGKAGNCKKCSESESCSRMFPADADTEHWYWSSSPRGDDRVWGALFDTGGVYDIPFTVRANVRCVR